VLAHGHQLGLGRGARPSRRPFLASRQKPFHRRGAQPPSAVGFDAPVEPFSPARCCQRGRWQPHARARALPPFVHRNGLFRDGAAAFPFGNATFPSAEAAFPSAEGAFPFGKMTFPSAKAAFPFAEGTFPSGKAAFPFAGGAFPFGKTALPSRKTACPSAIWTELSADRTKTGVPGRGALAAGVGRWRLPKGRFEAGDLLRLIMLFSPADTWGDLSGLAMAMLFFQQPQIRLQERRFWVPGPGRWETTGNIRQLLL